MQIFINLLCSRKSWGLRIKLLVRHYPFSTLQRDMKNSNKEIANFSDYAKGSAGELRTQIFKGTEI